MPGPLLTVTISESSTRGMMTGPLMIFGHGLLELVLVIALLSGLSPLLVRDDVFIFISLVGGGVLLWMGASMLKAVPSMQLHSSENVGSGPAGKRNLILSGILLSVINPYWLIWWASIGMGYISHSLKYGMMGIVAFFTGHILADLLWYTLVSTGIAKGKHLLSNTLYRWLIGCCAIFLLLFSCWFFFSGAKKLLSLTA